MLMRAIVLTIFLAGCATVGKPIDQDKLAQIKEGVTTKTEVIALFGQPYVVSLNSDGKEVLTYQYTKVKNKASNFIPGVNLLAGGMDMKQEMLQVLISADAKVEKYVLTASDTPINSGLLNTK